MLTHQAIAFEGDELSPKRLLDGQHTLSAIKKSGVSIIKWVFWECPSETFAYIDSGKTRTFLDRHRDKGWNKHTISFAIGVYRVLSSSRTDSPSESQMDEIMEIFGDEFNALLESCTTTKRGLTPIPVKIGFVYSMMSYPEHRQMFLDSWRLLVLGDLASLPLSFVKLFVKLTEIRGAGSDAARLQLATTVKCLNPKNWRLSKVHVNVDELYKETSDGLKRIMLKSD